MNDCENIVLSPAESVDFACSMLDRVRALLDGGRRWQPMGLAATRSGMPCEPTSSTAHYFSLKGAAYRAFSEMPQQAQCYGTGTIRLDDILAALTTANLGNTWLAAEMQLLGVRRALGEYRAIFEERRQRTR